MQDRIEARCPDCGAATMSQDRFCRRCGADLGVSGELQSSRKNVVIVFVDLIGSTSLAEWLDPEPLRALMDRYYRACTLSIVEHGGIVEKFIGDAIMAVFGMPVSREDDALRAVRAAVEAVRAVRELGAELSARHGVTLDVHCGVFSGEVIATTMPAGDLRVVGDAVNTAARLQSAAGPGEVLVGKQVAQVVQPHLELTAVAPLVLKGKSEPVPAWLVGGSRSERALRTSVPLIGRDDEMGRLHRAFQEAMGNRECRVVTVLGDPGLGKTRLVRDFLSQRRAVDVDVLVGECHSYGKGITYRPIADMLDSYPGGWPSIDRALGAHDDGRRILRILRAATGRCPTEPEAAAGRPAGGIEEIAWAVRSLFKQLADRRGIVVVCDDLHWAEPTLLDLLDDLFASLQTLPVLFIGIARPELVEVRPGWGDAAHATTVELDCLLPEQIDQFLQELSADTDVLAHCADTAVDDTAVDDTAVADTARVVDASGGNPLYAELMFDMLADGDELAVPPTVNALLSARIDSLPSVERSVLARAATIGREFDRKRLLALYDPAEQAPDDVVDVVMRLRRRRLVEHSDGPDGYRFAQALARDVAYAMTPKTLRRTWHFRLADWLTAAAESQAADRHEIAYHLEAACLLDREVDPGNPTHREMAVRAATELETAGTQALGRKDLPAAACLLERARDLLPFDIAHHRALAIRICDTWLGLGVQAKARGALELSEPAFASDERGRRVRDIQRQLLAVRFGTAGVDDLVARCDRFAAALADDPDDHLGWCRLHQLRAVSWLVTGQIGRAEEAMRDSVAHARAMNDRHEEQRLLIAHCELAQWSPGHVDIGLDLCAELCTRFEGDRALLVPVMVTRARLLALRGDLADARELLVAAQRHAHDLHLAVAQIAVTQVSGLVESLAGDHVLAGRLFSDAARSLHAAGQPLPARTLEVYAAREHFRAGAAVDDVLPMLPVGEQELRAELAGTVLRARLMAQAGQAGQAGRLAGAAAEQVARTDDLSLQADVSFELAQLALALGRGDEAVAAATRALRRYTDRGATLPASRVSGWLGSVRAVR